MQDRQAAERLFRHSKCEAIIVAVVWFLAMSWTVSYCYLHGYQHDEASWVVQHGWATPRDADNLHSIFGLPDWVAVGIVCPWFLSTAFTVFFCLVIMKDDDLGTEAGEEGAHGH